MSYLHIVEYFANDVPNAGASFHMLKSAASNIARDLDIVPVPVAAGFAQDVPWIFP
jgi:hypothetical protein